MTHPGPRNHTEKPSTPPAGPSGVSHQSADSSPPTPINLADEVVRMTAMVEQNLRVLLDTFGIPYTEWPAKTCRAALHRVGAGDPPGGVPCSLHLGHDGKHITESGRAWADPTDQQIRHVVDIVADVRAAGGSRSYAIDGVKISACDERGRTNADREIELLRGRGDEAEAALRRIHEVMTSDNKSKLVTIRDILDERGYHDDVHVSPHEGKQ
ncbi:hypothetical protein KNU54_gp78 [Gordonia phage VanDeWege]|uniref:Uncharacterized protein n=2 Tax=Wizardvirus TaxID=2169658 RepID=A0A4Y5TZV2_9CAUD|nr:hypothetical protein KNU54_gp78 [Gordonia phage VanDeWege]YP_010102328.1 hypothetical protein KNU56_gp77 [Gordonia phage Arri]QDB74660.1 hypothetical protein SEA_VANDEWEGE_78 [Gordonia phage VanDeWege]QDB74854.1 hypothetical protein SEA_ARRI_77 [Gordonia phage Arri]